MYEPVAHALKELEVDSRIVREFFRSLAEVIDPQDAKIIWFAADFDLMRARYENCESLVWRDVGALLATFTIVA